MSVAGMDTFHRAGCDDRCRRGHHDPVAHEEWGRHLERLDLLCEPIVTGPLVVDLLGRTVTLAGEQIHATERQWDILAYLAERVGRWCPVDEILAGAFGPEYVNPQGWRRGSPERSLERADRHLLRVHLARLRAKLGTEARLIETFSSPERPMRRLIQEPPS